LNTGNELFKIEQKYNDKWKSRKAMTCSESCGGTKLAAKNGLFISLNSSETFRGTSCTDISVWEGILLGGGKNLP